MRFFQLTGETPNISDNPKYQRQYTKVVYRHPSEGAGVGTGGGEEGGDAHRFRSFSCYLKLSIGASYPAELFLSRMLHQIPEHSR